MTVTGIGSATASSALTPAARWQIRLRDSGEGSTSDAGDSATISSEGFAALMQAQGGGCGSGGAPPAITDQQASAIGSTLQQKNPDLFAALDTDKDGSLSATELKTGLDALRPAGAGGGRGKPTDEQAGAIGSALQQKDPDLFTALDTDKDGSLSATELTSARQALRPGGHHHGGAGGPPPITDEQAGDVGSGLQQTDPDLLAALDQDQDGTLSSSELQSALDLLHPKQADGAQPAASGGDALKLNMMNDLLTALGGK